MRTRIPPTFLVGIAILLAAASRPARTRRQHRTRRERLARLVEPDRADTVFAELADQYGLPLTPAGCADGVYVGESPPDARDFRHRIRLEIRHGRIVAADYDEVHADGWGKQGDADYNDRLRASGANPAAAYPAYERALVAGQDLRDVDAVSGATWSRNRFRHAAVLALTRARARAGVSEGES